MPESDIFYFYLWRHRFVLDESNRIVSRTCFGITRNPSGRISGYEGHVGHEVKFARVWSGTERLIREIESRIKSDFYDYAIVGTNGFRLEWIDERIDFDTIVSWVEWEVSNTFSGITEVTGQDLGTSPESIDTAEEK